MMLWISSTSGGPGARHALGEDPDQAVNRRSNCSIESQISLTRSCRHESDVVLEPVRRPLARCLNGGQRGVVLLGRHAWRAGKGQGCSFVGSPMLRVGPRPIRFCRGRGLAASNSVRAPSRIGPGNKTGRAPQRTGIAARRKPAPSMVTEPRPSRQRPRTSWTSVRVN